MAARPIIKRFNRKRRGKGISQSIRSLINTGRDQRQAVSDALNTARRIVRKSRG